MGEAGGEGKLSVGLVLGSISWFTAGDAPVVRLRTCLVVSPGRLVEDREALKRLT